MSLFLPQTLPADQLAWNLRKPCADCPFRRDAPSHVGVAKSLTEYIDNIRAGRFAHTCHKTDNRIACDGPRNFKGDMTEHCAGALHFLIRSGNDLQLPLLDAAQAGRLDIKQASSDAAGNDLVFSSLAELGAYYIPVLEAELERMRNDPLVCVTFPEQFDDPPSMLPLSLARKQGLEILECLKCDQPASHYDCHWPYYQSNNFCNRCYGDLDELVELLRDLRGALA